MTPENIEILSQFRLFRPLGANPVHYGRYATDEAVAKSIVKWSGNILLGGHQYDLGLKPEWIFQIQSNMLNRIVYVVPIMDGELVRKIVSSAENKTRAVQRKLRQCVDKEEFLCGLLFLKRHVFRGIPRTFQVHKSETGWFMEDRYYLDVFTAPPRTKGKQSPKRPRKGKEDKPPLQSIFRVYPDSVACIEIPKCGPGPDKNTFNDNVAANTPEYYPDTKEIIMDWHELAAFLGEGRTGIYALSNFIASELEHGRQYVVGDSFFWGRTGADTLLQDTDISMADAPLWNDPVQPLRPELVARYDLFFKRFGSVGAASEIHVDTYSRTRLFESNLSQALIRYLLVKAGGGAQYLGGGFFRLSATNATELAAGTGNWGSGETQAIEISTEADDDDSGASTSGSVEGSGGAGLVTDGIRWLAKGKIAEVVAECRATGTSAACVECANDSNWIRGFHIAGAAADFVDAVGGILLCIFFPWTCLFTIPSAIASARDFWNYTFGGHSLAEDVCYGLPNAGAGFDVHDRQCEWRNIENVQCLTPEQALEQCRRTYGERDGNFVLTEAKCADEHSVRCRYCLPLVS